MSDCMGYSVCWLSMSWGYSEAVVLIFVERGAPIFADFVGHQGSSGGAFVLVMADHVDHRLACLIST
jgi:hypothetical protein